jgi:hypothetical protein
MKLLNRGPEKKRGIFRLIRKPMGILWDQAPPSRWREPRTEKHGGADHAQFVVTMKGAGERRWPYGFARFWPAIERGLAAHNDPQRCAIRRQYLVVNPLI